ncbi:hypothetical protein ABK040_004225 [Willaertia magna]
MSMYVRIKRQKTTIFLHCDPIDKISTLKERISQLTSISVDKQKLFRNEDSEEDLTDNLTLEELAISNDSILYLVYYDESNEQWESIDIPKPSYDEDEEMQEEED